MSEWKIATFEDAEGWNFRAVRGNVTLSGCNFETEDDALTAMRDTLAEQGESEPEKPKNEEKSKAPLNIDLTEVEKGCNATFAPVFTLGFIIFSAFGCIWLFVQFGAFGWQSPAPMDSVPTAPAESCRSDGRCVLYNNYMISEGCFRYHDCTKEENWALDVAAQIEELDRLHPQRTHELPQDEISQALEDLTPMLQCFLVPAVVFFTLKVIASLLIFILKGD